MSVHNDSMPAASFASLAASQTMESEALAMLREWKSAGTRIGFGHFRVKDGVIQTGTAFLRDSGPRTLSLDTGGSRLWIKLEGAKFEVGTAGFIRDRDYRDIVDVDGLSIALVSGDWLFLFQDSKPNHLHP